MDDTNRKELGLQPVPEIPLSIRGPQIQPGSYDALAVPDVVRRPGQGIMVHEDSLKLFLQGVVEHGPQTRKEWVAPLALLVSVLKFVLSPKADAFGLSGDTWFGIYVTANLAVGCWLVRSIIHAWRAKTIDECVTEFKETCIKVKND